METQGDGGPIDLDKTTITLEPDKTTAGSLLVQGKNRVFFRPQERKSLLGLDALANAKRAGSNVDGSFKIPRERVAFALASLGEDEERSAPSGIDDVGNDVKEVQQNFTSRRYCESFTSETSEPESTVTEGRHFRDSSSRHHSNESTQVAVTYSGSSQVSTPQHDPHDYGSRSSRSRNESRSRRRELREYTEGYVIKRNRYEGSRGTPGRSDWDEYDSRWESEDIPRRDSHSNRSRHHQPSPFPTFIVASPDALVVSPWLGGRNPTGSSASHWDTVAPPLPTLIRASGKSVGSSRYQNGGKSKTLVFSTNNPQLVEDGRVT